MRSTRASCACRRPVSPSPSCGRKTTCGRCCVARTLAAVSLPALVLLASWLRLEAPPRPLSEAVLVAVLGLLPALAPGGWRRATAAAAAALVAVPAVALDVRLDRDGRFVGSAARRFA